jgi:hypothetical protein
MTQITFQNKFKIINTVGKMSNKLTTYRITKGIFNGCFLDTKTDIENPKNLKIIGYYIAEDYSLKSFYGSVPHNNEPLKEQEYPELEHIQGVLDWLEKHVKLCKKNYIYTQKTGYYISQDGRIYEVPRKFYPYSCNSMTKRHLYYGWHFSELLRRHTSSQLSRHQIFNSIKQKIDSEVKEFIISIKDYLTDEIKELIGHYDEIMQINIDYFIESNNRYSVDEDEEQRQAYLGRLQQNRYKLLYTLMNYFNSNFPDIPEIFTWTSSRDMIKPILETYKIENLCRFMPNRLYYIPYSNAPSLYKWAYNETKNEAYERFNNYYKDAKIVYK